MSEEAEPQRPKLKLGVARFEAVNTASDQKQADAANLKTTLETLSTKVRESEAPVSIEKRRSKRKRDYWVWLIGGNLMILGLLVVLPGNVAVWAFTGAGLVIFNLGFTWIMWQVMDDY